MRTLRNILIILASTLSTQVLAQEPVFSQFYSSGLYLNPALAGVESETFFGANYRSQWSSLSLPFNTFQASFIHPVYNHGIRRKHLGGVGASLLSDVAGPNKEFSTQAFSLSGAWNIRLNGNDNHIISVALQTGIGQQRINNDNLRWSSQYSSGMGYDASLPGEASMNNMRVFRPIVNTGLIWSYTTEKNRRSEGVSFYNGLAFSNLAKTNSYFPGVLGDRSMIVKNHGGVSALLSNKFEISPNYLVLIQGKNRQVNIGSYAGYSMNANRGSASKIKVIAGVWYRLNDGLIFSTGLATNKINVGFSYDTNAASMGKSFGYAGAYELSMAYRVPGKNSFKRISSPLI